MSVQESTTLRAHVYTKASAGVDVVGGGSVLVVLENVKESTGSNSIRSMKSVKSSVGKAGTSQQVKRHEKGQRRRLLKRWLSARALTLATNYIHTCLRYLYLGMYYSTVSCLHV